MRALLHGASTGAVANLSTSRTSVQADRRARGRKFGQRSQDKGEEC